MQRTRSTAPARYVAGLLLWQGIGWLILAGTGLGLWIASLPGILNVYADGAAVLWTWLELLAIAVGLSIGAAEIGMSCRLRGGPKAVATVATGLRGLTLAGVLVVAAVFVMLAGSVLELLALNGTFLSHRRPPAVRLPSDEQAAPVGQQSAPRASATGPAPGRPAGGTGWPAGCTRPGERRSDGFMRRPRQSLPKQQSWSALCTVRHVRSADPPTLLRNRRHKSGISAGKTTVYGTRSRRCRAVAA